VFACIWAFGGCLLVDKLCDCRQQFSRWWVSEHKTVVFPQEVSTPQSGCCVAMCFGTCTCIVSW